MPPETADSAPLGAPPVQPVVAPRSMLLWADTCQAGKEAVATILLLTQSSWVTPCQYIRHGGMLGNSYPVGLSSSLQGCPCEMLHSNQSPIALGQHTHHNGIDLPSSLHSHSPLSFFSASPVTGTGKSLLLLHQ